jgi:hypothetical protein
MNLAGQVTRTSNALDLHQMDFSNARRVHWKPEEIQMMTGLKRQQDQKGVFSGIHWQSKNVIHATSPMSHFHCHPVTVKQQCVPTMSYVIVALMWSDDNATQLFQQWLWLRLIRNNVLGHYSTVVRGNCYPTVRSNNGTAVSVVETMTLVMRVAHLLGKSATDSQTDMDGPNFSCLTCSRYYWNNYQWLTSWRLCVEYGSINRTSAADYHLFDCSASQLSITYLKWSIYCPVP